MYKKQMIFERIVCFAVLIAAVLVFVYSLGIMTDMYDGFKDTIRRPERPNESTVDGTGLLYTMQPFNTTFTNLSVGLILASLTLFITNTHCRRKYYIGNVISVGISTVCNVAITAWALPQIMAYRAQYLQVDFEALKEIADRKNSFYTDSTFWFDISLVVFGILMVTTVLLIVNLILKFNLMKAEKSLIGSGKGVRA
ncbi:MAG: hypothetical protein K2N38_08670 [Oscillospiraceae bacterium]|nr:hypothetical protein [Oscillospiraceae bacterium]